MKVKLTFPEFNTAIGAATLRLSVSMCARLNAATTYVRTWNKRFDEELVGSCGELAMAKFINQFFVPSVNSFHRIPDIINDTEVRSTSVPNGRLILRNNDSSNRRYILAIVSAPEVELAGWIWGWQGMMDQFLDNPNDYRQAWFVPKNVLIPMEQFVCKTEAGTEKVLIQ